MRMLLGLGGAAGSAEAAERRLGLQLCRRWDSQTRGPAPRPQHQELMFLAVKTGASQTALTTGGAALQLGGGGGREVVK